MEWNEICAIEMLKDAPFKVETDRWGKIEMTPASNEHGMYQSEISFLLKTLSERRGMTVTECSVDTEEGTKVADVAWMSPQIYASHGRETPLRIAPSICIEILSPYNSMEEMLMKKRLYFACGADEVWICDREGKMDFYGCDGLMKTSAIFSNFPPQVLLPTE